MRREHVRVAMCDTTDNDTVDDDGQLLLRKNDVCAVFCDRGTAVNGNANYHERQPDSLHSSYILKSFLTIRIAERHAVIDAIP